jgi:hypothetical protein
LCTGAAAPARQHADLVGVGNRVEVAAHERRRVDVGVAAQTGDDAQQGFGLHLSHRRVVEAVVEVRAHDGPPSRRRVDDRAQRPSVTRCAVQARQRVADDVEQRPSADDRVVDAGVRR